MPYINQEELITGRAGMTKRRWYPGAFIFPRYSIKDHNLIMIAGAYPTYPDRYTMKFTDFAIGKLIFKYEVAIRLESDYEHLHHHMETVPFNMVKHKGEYIDIHIDPEDYGYHRQWNTIVQVDPR